MNNAHIDLVWRNYPSDESPVDEENLNRMVRSINLTDENVHNLDENKASKEELLEHTSKLFKDVQYNKTNGILTFTRKNGETITIDTPLEMVALDIFYDPVTEMLTLPLEGGGRFEVDLSRLITELEFLNSDTIAISVEEGKVKAIIKEGSIQEKHLRPDYLADIRVEQGKAQLSAGKSEEFAKLSESYAHGGTGVREGEDADNAMEYARQAKESADRASDIISSNIFPVTNILKNLTLTKEWKDTGIEGDDLESGVYIVCVKPAITGTFERYDEMFSGVMCWFSGQTTGNEVREILLHASGKKIAREIFLSTKFNVYGKLALQIAQDMDSSFAIPVEFWFRKLI